MKMQYIQFWVRDWTSDNALRMVSLEARGLWIDMICMMVRSPEYGFLLSDSGHPLTEEMLCKAVGMGCGQESIAKIKSLLNELELSGVFSRDDKMRIFSRRLLRESKSRKSHRESQKRYISKKRGFSDDEKMMPISQEPITNNQEASSHKPLHSGSVPTMEMWLQEGKRLLADEGWLKSEFIRLNDMNWELSGRPIIRWQSILARFWADFQSNRNFKRSNPVNKGIAFKDILPPGSIRKVSI